MGCGCKNKKKPEGEVVKVVNGVEETPVVTEVKADDIVVNGTTEEKKED